MLRTNHILRDSAECYMFHTFFGATKAVCSLMHTVLLVMPQQLNTNVQVLLQIQQAVYKVSVMTVVLLLPSQLSVVFETQQEVST